MSADQLQAARNCVSCKERKVRCDRRRPCSNCTKANRQCIFPTTGRILRQPQRVRHKSDHSESELDLMGRIRDLENVVNQLHARTSNKQAERHEGLTRSEVPSLNDMDGVEDAPFAPRSLNITGWDRSKRPINSPEVGVMLGEERGRIYVGDGFWADLQQELDAIKKNIPRDDYEDDDEVVDSAYIPIVQSSRTTNSNSAPSFIFSNKLSNRANTEDLRPLPSQMLFIWRTYVENVDPFIKILHVPTVSNMVYNSRGNFDLLPPSMEPLMYSVAFAAVTSLTSEEVLVQFRCDKQALVSRFRLGTEDSLSRVDFINTTELSVVQSFLIYVLIVRLEETQRFVWALTGLISRVAVALGINRDGSHFPDLTPFEAEMRRRAWCYVGILDFVTGDLQVPETSISCASSDAQLPANLNDDEIRPDMPILPAAGNGHSEMTVCLLRCKIWRVGNHIKKATASMYPCSRDPSADVLQRLEKLSQFSKQEFSEFLAATQPDKPIHRFTRTMAAIAVRRYELILDHIRKPSLKLRRSNLELDKQFLSALGILEDAHLLRHGLSTRHWAWQFHGFVQWHPLALVLSRLCVVEFDGMAERSWDVVVRTVKDLSESVKEEPLWQPLCNLTRYVGRRRLQQLKDKSMASTRGDPHHAATFMTTGAHLQSIEGSTYTQITNAPSGGELTHSSSVTLGTRQPTFERRSQDWYLAGDKNSHPSTRDIEGNPNDYRGEKGHLPVELGVSQDSLSMPTDQGLADDSFQNVGELGQDEWDDLLTLSEESMLWDRWAF